MPKMCPYNRAREVQRYKQKNELDESGNISSYAYEMGKSAGPGAMAHAVMRL